MGVQENPELFDFETTEAVAEFGDSQHPNLQIIAEYNAEVYNDLFVADGVVDEVGGREAYDRQREKVESFLRLDLLDRDAYQDIVPRAGSAELFVTRAESVYLVRAFRNGDGLFVSTRRNGLVDDMIDVVCGLVDGGE
ncbi:hypothetical protein BRD00_07575 [Halobacteriales archaeon QS_8_69_26]|nr:MAG: hypothetical protein BRD00_07575 [Halobacteriales archaeon QS_8_69_26]